MEELIEIMKKYGIRGVVIILGLSLCAYLITLFSACNVARMSSTTNEVTDKHIERTTSIELEK